MKQLYKIEVAPGLEYESIAECGLGLKLNDRVVVQCERYLDYAKVTKICGDPILDEAEFERQRAMNTKGRHIEGQKIPQILRIATQEDIEKAKDNDVQAFTAHNRTLERIKAHGLEMKLIQTHYSFDKSLIIFQFSADGRIDFRELLRDLSGLLKVRVELRQVGVRDEASILGGVGTCGRPFCCAKFLNSFNSINVKMAKQQGLSLNPQNISGCCGRLKCCLQFEAEIYKEISAEASQRQTEDVAMDDDTDFTDEMDDMQEAVRLQPLRDEGPSNNFQRPQQQGGNNRQQQQQRPRNNNGQNNNQQRQNNNGGQNNNNQQRRFDNNQNNRNNNNNNNRPRNNNNNNNNNGGNNNGNGQPPKQHKNPPKRPMPPPDKQVKHPLPPEA
ncbi:MAG: hypothetical protein K6G44_01610 [Lentisphaeria bacterium]|nr:hypothetical protein [Lentisphaeria bacterium]